MFIVECTSNAETSEQEGILSYKAKEKNCSFTMKEEFKMNSLFKDHTCKIFTLLYLFVLQVKPIKLVIKGKVCILSSLLKSVTRVPLKHFTYMIYFEK